LPVRHTSKGALPRPQVLRIPPSPAALSESPFAAMLELPFSRVVRALDAIESLSRRGFSVIAPRRLQSRNRAGRRRNQMDSDTLLAIARLLASELRTTNPTRVISAMVARYKQNPAFGQIGRATIRERLHNAARAQDFPSLERFLQAMAVSQGANRGSIGRRRKSRRRGRWASVNRPS
jgi:hypothetical protein